MNLFLYLQVLEELEKKFKGTYSTHNVMLSASHTHSGPGGYLQYTIWNIPTLGFVEESFTSIVGGIVKVKWVFYPRTNCYGSSQAFSSTRDSNPRPPSVESQGFIHSATALVGGIVKVSSMECLDHDE